MAVGGDGAASGVASIVGHASPLRVEAAKTPSFPLAHYTTSGRYPQVYRAGIPLVTVNAALRRGVVRFEEQAASVAVPYRGGCPGVFTMSPNRRLISASSVVVS